MREEPLSGQHGAAREVDPRLADHLDGPAFPRGAANADEDRDDARRKIAREAGERPAGDGAQADAGRHRRARETAAASGERGADQDPGLTAGVLGSTPEEPRLTVAAVARRLGVAPATLRTWDRRYGLGPTGHASGSHRRYGPEDVARLEQMQRALLRGASPAEAARYALAATPPLPRHSDGGAQDAPPTPAEPVLISGVLDPLEPPAVESTSNPGGRGLRLTGAGPRARGLGRAVLALDAWHQQRLLAESIEEQGVLATWREVLSPVLTAVSERWQYTGTGVEALRLLADSASTALRAVLANAPEPSNPRPVLLAPVPGEQQELELVALAAELASRGVGHRLFGAGLPPEGLNAAVRRAAPAVIVLWAEQPHYAAPALLADLPIKRQRARVFAVGAGWAPGRLPGHAEAVASLESAAELIGRTVLH
ncbi:MerR family transcriptional regulator [Saccharopolyspora sp. NFXS83]|uniref:MerR family transcriptional regulator n=1 Tax=Saccharopolyspora sp. NFXS83 TaxID=2993560 RepID=UPI00224ACCE1|nr:MerR family transcriptional regulator [Saccharopolyspora sp. NFXS83]MCX2734196.1 MerR family transcriptional regulator [Saccharopolyspora sp. NFXS83]